jgi:DNA (cytosine-5)-methyltransferase 1
LTEDNDEDSGQPRIKESVRTSRADARSIRNGPVEYPLEIIPSYTDLNLNLKAGKSVELRREGNGKHRFLRIHHILKNSSTGQIFLRGQLFHRNRNLGAILKHSRNEIYLFQQVDCDDPRPPNKQAMIDIALEQVKKVRKIIITDEKFPAHSFRNHTVLDPSLPGYEEQKKIIADNDELVCRFVYTMYFLNAQARTATNGKCARGELRHIRRIEADKNHQSKLQPKVEADPSALTKGSRPVKLSRRQVDPPRKKRKYIYGSGFGGAGGESTGAVEAGARLLWAWDENSHACQTLAANHPWTVVYQVKADDFLKLDHGGRVDIYHLSPPCNFFSPNHNPNRECAKDGDNIAALYGTKDHLEFIKPRVVTMENTFGLKAPRHSQFFEDMIAQILSAGYDVHWQVDDFRDCGLSARRKRLIVFGAL